MSYSSTILADSPIRYYRLGESSGTTANDSGSQVQNGTLHGTVTLSQSSLIATDTANTAMRFDGSTGYISLPTTGLPTGAASWTIEAWCSVSTSTPITDGGYHALIGFGTYSTHQMATLFLHSGQFVLSTYSGDIGGGSPVAGGVYHVVGTYDGAQVRLYVNGQLVAGPTTFSLNIALAFANIAAGSSGGPVDWLPGTLDEVAIYSSALSASQILAHYTAATSFSSTYATTILNASPTAYYRLDEASGTIAHDQTTNHYDATLSGTITYSQTGAIIGDSDTSMLFGANSTLALPYTLNPSTFSALSLEYWIKLTSGWQYVVVTTSNTTGQTIIYLNGAVYSSGSGDPVLIDTDIYYAGSYLTGNLDEVALYNYVLTPSQIIAHYQAGGHVAPPSGGFALWANGTGTASFDHFRVTQYPDPSLSLAPVIPRAGSTLVAWNAIGSLATAISLDGMNFTDVSSSNGGALPGIFVQPAPTIDSFDSDSHTSYTSTNRTGGATATWTYDTTNSRISATGGTNGLFVYNAISRADIDMLADLDRSDAGGLVWRYIDQSDFYYLVVADASASVGTPNQLTLNKISGNVLTQLATAAITFARGTYHRIHVTMSNGVISVLFDGASAISYTDGSPLGAGLMGLYNNGGSIGSRYYELWMTPQGDYVTGTPAGNIVTGDFVYTKLTLSSTNPTATPQVLDLTAAAHGPNIGNGLLIPQSNYHYTFISNNMDDLARKSNYYWTIDATGKLIFLPGATIPAPWILNSSDPLIWELTVEYSNDLYSNRQVLINVVDVTSFTNTFVGNGQSRSFAMGYPLASVPTVTLNGQAQTVGLKGTTGSAYYYAIGDANLAQDASQTILQQTDVLVVSATGTYTTDVTRDNITGQAALAALDGSTGIVEAVTDVSQIGGMNIAAANAYGDTLNVRQGVLGRTVKFITPKTGLAPGQTLPAFISWRNMVDVQLTIISIETSIRTIRQGAGAANRYIYAVEASEVASTGSWQKTIAKVKT